MPLPRRNILIFHQAALGDFVVTWPLAMALGRVFAQSRVSYVTNSDKGRLAEDAIGVEYRSADDGWHTLYGDAEPPEPVRRTLAATQCVVVFGDDASPTFVGNLAKHAGDVPLIPLQAKPPAGTHVWAHHLAQLAGQGNLGPYVEQMQSLVRTQGVGRGPTPGGPVVIHPGSGSPDKNWPLTSFLDVARGLLAAGRAVRFVVGEVERERWQPSVHAGLAAVAPVETPPDLPALKRELAAASAYVGNDSGPTHLAATLGLPTVAVFGPASDEAAWRPNGPRVVTCAFDTTPAHVVAAIADF